MILSVGNMPVLVDDDDEALLSGWCWYIHNVNRQSPYVRGCIKGRRAVRYLYMHRVLLNAQRGDIVDHINGNGLDNRRSNLRIVSRCENLVNTHVRRAGNVRGTWFDKRRGTWTAFITINKRRTWLGSFASQEQAKNAYDVAANAAFGHIVEVSR